jgi:hypothetical protein
MRRQRKNPGHLVLVDPPRERAEGVYGAAVACVVMIVWLASLIRAVGALVDHETFGAEATIALLIALLVPWSARFEIVDFGGKVWRKITS